MLSLLLMFATAQEAAALAEAPAAQEVAAPSIIPGAPAAATPSSVVGGKLDCNLHKFEKIVSATVDGALKSSRLRLCGTEGQSSADWIETLEDSAGKLRSSASLSEAMKLAMVAALETEVARLKLAQSMGSLDGSVKGTGTAPSEFTLKPREKLEAKGEGSLKDYAALPPIPIPVPGQQAKPVAPPKFVRPDVRFQCFSAEDIAEGPCDYLNRYSVIVLQARTATAQGATLVFAVDGDEREELDIGGMRKGQRRRIPVPASVCRGVSSARLELRTMVMAEESRFGLQTADRAGPYILQCQ